jgi:hypothetical protein
MAVTQFVEILYSDSYLATFVQTKIVWPKICMYVMVLNFLFI